MWLDPVESCWGVCGRGLCIWAWLGNGGGWVWPDWAVRVGAWSVGGCGLSGGRGSEQDHVL